MTQNNNSILGEFIPEKDLLRLLDIGKTTLWRLRKRGIIKGYKLEGQKRNYYSINQVLNFKENILS
jgi:hypothetical protein